MNCKNKCLQCFSSTLFFLLIASLSFGQSNPTKTNEHSSITLKTLRALFPEYPVAIANEIHGGLHVVSTVDELHGVSGALKIDDSVLQKGMLVWVQAKSMYYYYVGDPLATDNKNNASDGPSSSPIVDDVDTGYWKTITSLNDDAKIESVVVVSNCADVYRIELSSGNVDTNNDQTYDYVYSGHNNPPEAGDHLILMPTVGNAPLAVYVWDVDTNDDRNLNDASWVLISTGTQVIENTNWYFKGDKLYEGDTEVTQIFNEGDIIKTKNNISFVFDGHKWLQITNETEDDLDLVLEVKLQFESTSDEVDLNQNPEGNGYLASAYSEGDIIKLIDANGVYVTYAATDSNRSTIAADGWLEIARGIQPKGNNIEFPVYYGDYTGTPTFTSASANAISLDAFRSQINTNASNGLSLTGANTGVAIEYPAAWGNLSYSISDSGNTFELTNGVNITVVEKTIGGVTVDYKQVTIPCGTSTIIVN